MVAMSRLEELERNRQIAGIRAMIAPSREPRDADSDEVADVREVESRELTGFGDGFEPPRGAFRARMAAHRRSAGVFVAVAVITAAATALGGWLLRPAAAPASTTPDTTVASADEQGDQAASQGRTATSTSAPPPTATTIVVAVVGQVMSPGLVTLPDGARVSDAIAAAGGAVPGTDLSTINIARKVTDGEQIAVGIPGAVSDGGPSPPSGGAGAAPPQKVNINSAGVGELDSLPGIGPVLAQRIVDFRTENGPFKTVDDLANVSGVGPSILAKISGQVTV